MKHLQVIIAYSLLIWTFIGGEIPLFSALKLGLVYGVVK